MTANGRIETDIAIVGAGMVGKALACAFAPSGLDVTLIDARTDAGGRDARVSAIAYGSRRILEGIGAWDAIAAHAQPIVEIRVCEGDSPLFLHYDSRDLDGAGGPLGYIAENAVINAALDGALADLARLRRVQGMRIRDQASAHGRMVLASDDGRSLGARLAIAADGANSPMRARGGLDVLAWRYAQVGIVCTVRHARPHDGIAVERFLPAGPFAILPMTGNRSSLVWTEHADVAPAILALDDAAFAAELGRRFGDYLGDLAVEGERASYPLALVTARRFIADRLALLGDAAHTIHPIAGQGLNLGLRDVAALAEVVVDARRLGLDIGALDVLERYDRWRRLDTLALMAVTDGLNRLFSNDIGPIGAIRRLGLALVDAMPDARRFFMRAAMGLVGERPRLARGEPL